MVYKDNVGQDGLFDVTMLAADELIQSDSSACPGMLYAANAMFTASARAL